MIKGPNKYLCIGHICHDQSPNGVTLGGTPVFARPWINALGFDCSLITSYGLDFRFSDWTQDLDCKVLPAEKTSVFENIYKGQNRVQYLRGKAAIIKSSDVLDSDITAEVIHLCPIANEVDLQLLYNLSPDQFTVATPQGWLRYNDQYKLIHYKPIDWSQLKSLNAIVISEEDVPNLKTLLPSILIPQQLFVVTKGAAGSIAYLAGKDYFFPAYPVPINHLTGLGDAFSAVLFAQYYKTQDLEESMIMATCAASIQVEFGIMKAEQLVPLLEKRVKDYYAKYGKKIYQP